MRPAKPTVHMIWIGSPLPQRYKRNIQSYTRQRYKVRIWTEPPQNMVNKRLYDAAKTYALKADIMRLEIIYQYGGIYTDIDSRMKLPLPIEKDLVLMTSASGFIANETFYATKGHPALKEAIDGMEENVQKLKRRKINIWDIAGATYITPIFEKHKHIKLTRKHIGNQRFSPRIIAHQYNGSWRGGRPKAEKRKMSDWIEL